MLEEKVIDLTEQEKSQCTESDRNHAVESAKGCQFKYVSI